MIIKDNFINLLYLIITFLNLCAKVLKDFYFEKKRIKIISFIDICKKE